MEMSDASRHVKGEARSIYIHSVILRIDRTAVVDRTYHILQRAWEELPHHLRLFLKVQASSIKLGNVGVL
jgi:hypothetical protein